MRFQEIKRFSIITQTDVYVCKNGNNFCCLEP